MAKRKRPSWVGGANPIDVETNLQRPLKSMTSAQRSEALKDSPSVAAVQPRTKKESPGKVGPRPKFRNVTRAALTEAGVREPKTSELKRGLTQVKVDTATPKKRKAKGRTATGKKLDPTTGKIAEPKVGQIGKVEGKTVRVTPENLTQVYKERLTTVLPKAGPEVMTPASPGPRVPMEVPSGGLREKKWVDKGTGKVSRKLRGFGIPAEKISELSWKAMGHLEGMMGNEPGTKAYNQHKIDFHGTLSQIEPHSKDVHTLLLGAQKVAVAPKYGKQQSHFNMAKDALSERISIGRAMERGRKQRQGESR